MIIVKSAITNGFTMTADVDVFADTKAEVTNDPSTYEGMPTGYSIAPGSTIMTASGEMAFWKSDNTWNWV